jgi:hypothetical protein
MAQELLRIASSAESESVRLGAVKDALDRAGLGAKTAIEIEVGPPKPYEQILGGISAITREESRARRGVPDAAPAWTPPALAAGNPDVVDAEVLDDGSSGGPGMAPHESAGREWPTGPAGPGTGLQTISDAQEELAEAEAAKAARANREAGVYPTRIHYR